MKNFLVVWLLIMGLSGFAKETLEGLDNEREFQIGDHFVFWVEEDPAAQKILRVSEVGEIDFPRVGKVSVQGLTAFQIAERVKAKHFRVRVSVVTPRIFEVPAWAADRKLPPREGVLVIGAVTNEGNVDLAGGERITIEELLKKAGTYTRSACRKSLVIIRRSEDYARWTVFESYEEGSYTFRVEEVGEETRETIEIDPSGNGEDWKGIELKRGDELRVPYRKIDTGIALGLYTES